MADGKVSIAYSTFLGNAKGPDGNLVVNKEQAEIVRLIYRKFMEGMVKLFFLSQTAQKLWLGYFVGYSS